MHEISGLLMRLNYATRHAHAAVDAPWLDLLRADVTRHDYLAQLVRAYGLLAPFEAACRYTPDLHRAVDDRHLSRAGMIAQDLLSLGLTPGQIANLPQCWSITTFADVPEALGWLYVVERSTLVQEGVRRHLLAREPSLETAASYLSMFDGRVSDHWQTFGRILDRAGATPAAADAVIAAAIDGFSVATRWFCGAAGHRETA